MAQISINNLTFCYDGSFDNIFENVSFSIDTDWRLGFVGRNGRGKTTFLRLLQGKLEGYSGRIFSPVEFDYFPFEIANKALPAHEAISSAVTCIEQWRLERELGLLGLDVGILQQQFDTLSGGEQSRLMLAALLSRDNNFLLIDEPTNHLDSEGRQAVARYLSRKKSFILVSHDRDFLDACVDHILSINRADIEVQRGNFSSWLANKERQDSFELAENQKLKSEIARLEQSSMRSMQWAQKGYRNSTEGRKAGDEGLAGFKEFHRKKAGKLDSQKAQLERRQSRAIEQKSQLLKNVETISELKISPLTHHKQTLVEITDLSISYDGRAVLSGFDMSIEQGERIAIVGKNGSGKSSILKLLADKDIQYLGDVNKASRLKISYVPQDTSFLRGSLRELAELSELDETKFMTILAKLDFSKAQLEKDMQSLSQGQKKKVLIAKSLSEQAHLYIWDEPLNYIDIFSRLQIEQLITTSNPTMLIVEHDAAFLAKIATKTIQLKQK